MYTFTQLGITQQNHDFTCQVSTLHINRYRHRYKNKALREQGFTNFSQGSEGSLLQCILT